MKRSLDYYYNGDIDDNIESSSSSTKYQKISEFSKPTTTIPKLTFKDFKRDVETNNGNKPILDNDLRVIKDVCIELSKSHSDAVFNPKNIISSDETFTIPIIFDQLVTYKTLRSIRVQCGTLFKSMIVEYDIIKKKWKVNLVVYIESVVSVNKRLEDRMAVNARTLFKRKISHIRNFNDIITSITNYTDHPIEKLRVVIQNIIDHLQNRWILQDPISIHVATNNESDEYFLVIKGIQKINYNLIDYIAGLDNNIVNDNIELIENENIPILYIKINKKI